MLASLVDYLKTPFLISILSIHAELHPLALSYAANHDEQSVLLLYEMVCRKGEVDH
jgi:hypothetical protein